MKRELERAYQRLRLAEIESERPGMQYRYTRSVNYACPDSTLVAHSADELEVLHARMSRLAALGVFRKRRSTRYTPPAHARKVGRDGSRSEDRPSARYFTGRAVVYNSWSEPLAEGRQFKEQIAPGAFDESLKSPIDIYASIDHMPFWLLGRQSAGTLRLLPSRDGIDVEVDRPPYSYAQDLAAQIQRGDLRGMSFIFEVSRDQWTNGEGLLNRTVLEAELYEVSFVFQPAYPESDVGLS
jgi:HK97 family phage prohead protease